MSTLSLSERETPPIVRLSFGLLAFMALHVVIGPLFYEIRQLAVLHVFIVMIVAFWWAISPTKPIEWIAYAAAYICGGEILWRVTRVAGPVFFYEFAKYAIAALFILASVVRGRFNVRHNAVPILYFALLLPSALIPLTEQDFQTVQGDLSFNLSGPFTLALSAWFFGNLDADRIERRTLLLSLMAPILSVAAITLFLIITRDVAFGGGSNKDASGNFGPNQVSAMLGAAGVAAVLCMVEDGVTKMFRLLMLAIMVFVLIQSALTFSRGGLYTFIGSSLLGFVYLAGDARKRVRLVVACLALYGLAEYVVIPRLDQFTDGTLTQRFEDTRLSGRDSLVESEIEIWLENPLFGVGPGQAMHHRDVSVVDAAAHTEFSRLLAEHGLFGLTAASLLAVMLMGTLRSTSSTAQKAFAVTMWTWSCLFMVSNGMRLVAPAFLIGLSVAKRVDLREAYRRTQPYFRQVGIGRRTSISRTPSAA